MASEIIPLSCGQCFTSLFLSDTTRSSDSSITTGSAGDCWSLLLVAAAGALCQASITMLHGEPLQSSLLATPASHHHVVVNSNIFCRQTHPSDWHHIFQNQNVCKSLEGFCRFPLQWEIQERQKNTITDSAQAEGFSTPCWAALSSLHDCAVSQGDARDKAENKHPIKTNRSTAPASPSKERMERTTSMWTGVSHDPYWKNNNSYSKFFTEN